MGKPPAVLDLFVSPCGSVRSGLTYFLGSEVHARVGSFRPVEVTLFPSDGAPPFEICSACYERGLTSFLALRVCVVCAAARLQRWV